MSARASAIEAAVDRLWRAAEDRVACDPVRDLLGDQDIDLAYAVQLEITSRRLARGEKLSGHKIGLTSEAVQGQMGVKQPDFGVLFDTMNIPSGGAIPAARVLQPKVEAEIAFVLADDLDGDDLGPEACARAVGAVHAAIEIVDSRIRGWDIRITDTVADNASSGLFVLSDAGLPIGEVPLEDVTMQLRKNGEVVSSGTGRATLGSPLVALAWLARTAQAAGDPLKRGDIVLSGALGPMADVVPGDHIEVELSVLGDCSAQFTT